MDPKAVHKPFDSTLKELAERRPRPWMSLLLGRPVGDVQVINADLSTITAEADKLFRVGDPRPWIVHTEFETSYKADAPHKGLRYSVLARSRHELPVQTIFVLLRPGADGDAFTGTLEEELPDGTKYLLFRYNVLRVWELPAEQLLAGDLATLPLAPIARATEEEIPAILRRIDERIGNEASPGEAAELWMATSMLLGLTHSGESLKNLLQGVHRMKESATYQMILEEGREEGREEGQAVEAKKILLRQGRRRFGEPTPGIRQRLDDLADLEQMERLLDRLFEVSNWEELLEVS